jgi:transcriptional regulator with GAF, ATPase, and Fis domain
MNTSNENRKRGSFHNDLYYRLNTIHIKMPSLREMQDDIPLLANYFLNSFTGELGRNSMRFSPYLLNYGWPRNVRELEKAVKRRDSSRWRHNRGRRPIGAYKRCKWEHGMPCPYGRRSTY